MGIQPKKPSAKPKSQETSYQSYMTNFGGLKDWFKDEDLPDYNG